MRASGEYLVETGAGARVAKHLPLLVGTYIQRAPHNTLSTTCIQVSTWMLLFKVVFEVGL